MKIETERLFLREMTEADYDILYTVFADSDIMQHYPYTFDAARVKNWIAKNRERYRVFGFGLWAVWLKENDKMIGDCGLTMQNIDGTILPEIGYHIAKSHQRNGYAKEAAHAVLDWTFNNTPFRAVYSYMKKANIPSSATALANGMHRIRQFVDSEGESTVVYGIKREEWLKFEYENQANILRSNIEKIHTTPMGEERIRKNLQMKDFDTVEYCKALIASENCRMNRQGKNWYCENRDVRITVNASNYTIITAHRTFQAKQGEKHDANKIKI